MSNKFLTLLVDDDESALRLTELSLRDKGICEVTTCSDSREVLTLLEVSDIDVVLLDLMMPHVSGMELLTLMMEAHPEVPVVVLTGTNEIRTAVECVKLGAFDYFVKPADVDGLILSIQRAMEIRELCDEYESFRKRSQEGGLESPGTFEAIITSNERMQSCFRYIEAVAPSRRPALITGETGTGKELVARALHDASGRQGPFLALNVAGLDDSLFSDSLFGHVRGAFTGADTNKEGLVELASGGTLFLDEIGDLSLPSQAKLLRLIQEGEYLPVGANEISRNQARIVVSTHHDLQERQKTGLFRRDLFYRLRTHRVDLPPLRERLEDLPALLEHFVERASEELGKPVAEVPKSLVAQLRTLPFPGNVRELEGLVYDAMANLGPDNVLALNMSESMPPSSPVAPDKPHKVGVGYGAPMFSDFEELPTLRNATTSLIDEALARTDFNQAAAAELLGMTRAALNKRLTRAKHGQNERVDK
jgi:DNA-binding NtrC family response regulator